jgi:hypothetical protein
VHQRTFKLNASTTAILAENDQRTIVTIPANAVVTRVVGDADGDGFLKVRYRDKILSVFAVDLRTRGEGVSGTIGVARSWSVGSLASQEPTPRRFGRFSNQQRLPAGNNTTNSGRMECEFAGRLCNKVAAATEETLPGPGRNQDAGDPHAFPRGGEQEALFDERHSEPPRQCDNLTKAWMTLNAKLLKNSTGNAPPHWRDS